MVHPGASPEVQGTKALHAETSEPSGAGWTHRPEYHLGDPAHSLFDPNGERSAVGLTLFDAQAICRAMNTVPALYEALKTLSDQVAGYGTTDANLIHQARAALAQTEAR